MKNLTEYINESIVNEGVKDWLKDIATKGILKARNAWNKITDALTNDYHPHLPAIMVEKMACNPQEWDDPDQSYDASLIDPIYSDLKQTVATAIYHEVEGKDITLYAGGHYAFDACVYELEETDKEMLMDRWSSIIDYCMKTYNKGNTKVYNNTDRYNKKNTFIISVEINNNGFYDSVDILMYI